MAGSLKLKGGPSGATVKNKKKKKSSTTEKLREEEYESRGSGAEEEGGAGSPSGSGERVVDAGKTEAQRRFEEVQKKRLLEKAAKAATKTHKERVAEFNEKLENLSEHYDIPKVGPG